MTPLLQTNISDFPCRRGKVRDIYDLGEQLLIVATDRISAFDWVLPTGIPDKGRILTQLSKFWFDFLNVPNHLLSVHFTDLPAQFEEYVSQLAGRMMLVRKTIVVPIECIVRGYLVGSGWKNYKKTGAVCGIALPKGLQEAQQLPEPIFTPSTKADSGHDVNISFEEMIKQVGLATAEELQRRSIDIYRRAAEHTRKHGILLADTKFEWGRLPNGQLILIDEVLTPDSSRFWPDDQYKVGSNPPSFDKQFVRDWLESVGWNKKSTPPALPSEIVEQTRMKYVQAYELLTGKKFM